MINVISTLDINPAMTEMTNENEKRLKINNIFIHGDTFI